MRGVVGGMNSASDAEGTETEGVRWLSRVIKVARQGRFASTECGRPE